MYSYCLFERQSVRDLLPAGSLPKYLWVRTSLKMEAEDWGWDHKHEPLSRASWVYADGTLAWEWSSTQTWVFWAGMRARREGLQHRSTCLSWPLPSARCQWQHDLPCFLCYLPTRTHVQNSRWKSQEKLGLLEIFANNCTSFLEI